MGWSDLIVHSCTTQTDHKIRGKNAASQMGIQTEFRISAFLSSARCTNVAIHLLAHLLVDSVCCLQYGVFCTDSYRLTMYITLVRTYAHAYTHVCPLLLFFTLFFFFL